MPHDRYQMSFTTGALLIREGVSLAELYLQNQDWRIVRDKVLSENLLQSRTLQTSKKICREVISRLKKLQYDEFEFLVRADSKEQAYLLWMAVCRRYRFIAEFALEVLRERYISLQTDISYEDFDVFYNRKAEWHPELEDIRPVTRNKLRQVLFKMMREADLLGADNTIHPAMLTPQFLAALPQEHRADVRFFPVFEVDIKGRAQ